MIDLSWKLKLLQLLEYQFAVREILFGVLGIMFLSMAWRFVGKVINLIFKRKK
jgi:hypothetical protein